MRYLLLSDIHANLEALNAVLADSAGRYDRVLNCGDLVGYGPDPNEVAEWCREHTPEVVRGNHDKAVTGLGDLEWFNPAARTAALWTREILTADNRQYLENLPRGPQIIGEQVGGEQVEGEQVEGEQVEFVIVHGSPKDEDDYVFELGEAAEAASYLERALTFFGHTHMQGGFMVHRNGIRPLTGATIALENDVAYLINPGSVGQPRDRDPRAAYAIYDDRERLIELCRAEYNIEKTQAKMLASGLPEQLAIRLAFGR